MIKPGFFGIIVYGVYGLARVYKGGAEGLLFQGLGLTVLISRGSRHRITLGCEHLEMRTAHAVLRRTRAAGDFKIAG